MPVITGADLSNVSTTYQPLPSGTYKTTIAKADYESEPKERVIIRHKVVESPDGENIGREFSDYIYLRQKDGRPNEIGLKQLKRYLEATLGKDAANTSSPNTDDLVDQSVTVELGQETYKPADGEPRINNVVKRVVAA